MVWTIWVALGACFAALGVGLGAFGAHALKLRLLPEDLAIFEVGVRYQMYHALALLGLGLVASRFDSLWLKAAGFCFLFGILIFSGTLYILVLTQQRWLGAITPIGGALLILAWLFFMVASIKASWIS